MEVTVRLFILTGILAISGCSHIANDQWSGQGKVQHFIVSAMLAAAGNEYAQHQGNSHDRGAAIGPMFPVSLGVSKGLWGSRPVRGNWSWRGFAWGVADAFTGYAVWQLARY